ncbi:MAG: hypothetical protein IPK26_07910 [Planctomycetes bacterium]|nr:hypothetical protein [Planctomycetota bacterium]
MTKLATSDRLAPATPREVRPFLYLDPIRSATNPVELDPAGLRVLTAALEPAVPMLVRAVVDQSVAGQHGPEISRRQPPQVSVLNRRRRAARAWLMAIAGGAVDAGTLHAVGTQWLPTLAGAGPELDHGLPMARALVEFVRGAATALVFDAPAENLLPQARALHVLESILSVHLSAAVDAARRPRAV